MRNENILIAKKDEVVAMTSNVSKVIKETFEKWNRERNRKSSGEYDKGMGKYGKNNET
jgi:hypothetical protein